MRKDPSTKKIVSGHDISFRKLLAFRDVMRLRTLRLAAAERNTSQPALTGLIGSLENYTNMQLFTRSTRGMLPTGAAVLFKPFVDTALNSLFRCLNGFEVTDLEGLAWRLSASRLMQLRAVRAYGSLNRAAIVLGMATSNVRASVRELERVLAAPLLDSGRSDAGLNSSGCRLADSLTRINNGILLSIKNLRSVEPACQVRIGISLETNGSYVASLVANAMSRFSHASFLVVENTQMALMSSLDMGDIDIVFGMRSGCEQRDRKWLTVQSLTYRVVARKRHPIFDQDTLTTARMLDFDWVTGPSGSLRRQVFDEVFGELQIPVIRLITTSLLSSQCFIANSDALFLATQEEINTLKESLVAHPFSGGWNCAPVDFTFRSSELLEQFANEVSRVA